MSGAEIAFHFAVFVLVWLASALPGFALATGLGFRRAHSKLAAALPLGIAYWSIALYLFPWRGGLHVACALAGGGAVAAVLKWRRIVNSGPIGRTSSGAWFIIALGCLSFCTVLCFQRLPSGMDASRYMYNARLIAVNAGLPATLAPFAPQIPFGAANHGVPAWAAVAVMLGATPDAAIVATSALSYVALILACGSLARRVVHAIPAAVIAVSCVWLSRGLESALEWGGTPGVMVVAMGCVAAECLFDVLRKARLRDAATLGILVAAMTIVHACMAAGWIYVIGVPAALGGLWMSRWRLRGIGVAALALVVAVGCMTPFVFVGRPALDEFAISWIRTNELASAFPGHGIGLFTSVPAFVARESGRLLSVLTLAAVVLAIARRVRLIWLSVLSVVILLATVWNARFEWLPATYLLYPSRLPGWGLLGAVFALALAFRSLTHMTQSLRQWRVITGLLTACGLLAIAGSHHAQFYQAAATRATVDADTWTALLWCREHLDAKRDFVATLYATPGAYLPGLAGVGVTQWHAHISQQLVLAEEMARSRTPTHALWIERSALLDGPAQRAFDQQAPDLRRLIEEGNGISIFERGVASVYRLASPRPKSEQHDRAGNSQPMGEPEKRLFSP